MPTLVDEIRFSCAECARQSHITIDHRAIDRFILSVDPKAWQSSTGAEAHGVRLPLRFETDKDELNSLATLALLNFLSGYREPLHRLTGRGAYSTILSLVLSAYLSSTPDSASSSPSLLTAAGMRQCTAGQISELARIKMHVERPHETLGPAVTVGEKDEEAIEVCELLAGVLRETGEALQSEGKTSLGEWVAAKLRETGGDVGEMVKALASTFPAFNDSHTLSLSGSSSPLQVHLYKKALWLLTVVNLRFSSSEEKPSFPLPKTEGLPVFADNVLPSLLIHLSILLPSSSHLPGLSTVSLSDPSTLLFPSPSATSLRAAALHACSLIVKRAQELGKTEWTERKLDAFLWNRAKEGEWKEVGRMGERGTVYY
ncbi:hypothetical protein JCM8547_002667 [Rhodosporidiobolus lusitaniae]